MANQQRCLIKQEYWRTQVQQWRDSGLSVRLFCRQNQLAETSFFAWRRELEIRARESATELDTHDDVIPRFIVVDVVHEPDGIQASSNPDSVEASVARTQTPPDALLDALDKTPPTLEIETRSGILIRVREEVSAEILRRVLDVCQTTGNDSSGNRQEVGSC